MPLARPAGWRNVDSRPSVLHFRMRSLGWSVNSTFPSASHVGPSVNAKPPASFSTVASGATTRSPLLHGMVPPAQVRPPDCHRNHSGTLGSHDDGLRLSRLALTGRFSSRPCLPGTH